jgi:hypothetical protein
MPPQPLSRVRPKAEIFVGATGAVRNRSNLTQLIARTIAIWSDIEYQIGGMLGTMLGEHAAPSAAMFHALTSSVAQMAVLRAAVEHALSSQPKERDLFDIITKQMNRSANHRNRFVHWVWAHTFDLPNVLMFIPPEVLLTHDISNRTLVAPFDGHALSGEIDRAKIMIYREKDLKEVVDLFNLMSTNISQLRMLLIPKYPSGPRDLLYQYLVTQPEIAEALSHLNTRRQNDPTARPSRRRKGRTT